MLDIEKIKIDLYQKLKDMNMLSAKKLIENVLEKITITELSDKVIVEVLDKIGKDWEKGELALSQIYMSGRFFENIFQTINPTNVIDNENNCKVAIGVFEDYHLLGKRIVLSLLRANNIPVLDLKRVDTESLILELENNNIDILLLSTLMLTSALHIKDLRKRLDEIDFKGKLIVGGAPFRYDRSLYKEVGADSMCVNAADALNLVLELRGGKK